MVNKQKFISKLEDVIYSYGDKYSSDKLFTNFIKLLNYLNLDDFKVDIKYFDNIKILIKHKAFDKVCYLWFINNELYLNENKIDQKDVNKIIENYFAIDKKNK